MKTITFTVPGKLWGYRRPKDMHASYQKYAQFKNLVLGLAMEKGWKCRAVSLPDFPVYLSVFVNWVKGPRTDWPNIYKAIEDGLFEQDRHVHPGKLSDFACNTGKEEAIVTLEF